MPGIIKGVKYRTKSDNRSTYFLKAQDPFTESHWVSHCSQDVEVTGKAILIMRGPLNFDTGALLGVK